jgi:fibro-slime domain-containing protein
MWIFIDGDLFEDDETGAHADLGGNHLAAPAVIDIKRYAGRKGWANGSMHVINFFYVERQTDGSNLMLELAISNLTPSIFGAPYIKRAETQIKDDITETILYVSNQINVNDFREFLNNPSYGFPILVKSPSNNDDIYGYKLESIEFGARVPEGYTYIITGKVCKDVTCSENNIVKLSTGDSLSFNVVWDDKWPASADTKFALSDESKSIRNMAGQQTTELGDPNKGNKWGPNSTLRTIEIPIKTPDTNPKKPPFAAGNPENSGAGGKPAREDPNVPGGSGGPVGGYEPRGAGQVDNITQDWSEKEQRLVPVPQDNKDVHGFGVVGAQIPPQRAGELILTAFPNSATAPNGFASYEDWYTAFKEGKIDGNADLFGLPPEVKGDDWWGLVDPTLQALGGGYQFVKNGFPNESNTKGNIRIAPTRCTADIKWDNKPGERASINCLNFNMVVQQPFQVAVTVYDQLGNFVTQYRETISEQDFRNVTQAPNYLPENKNTVGNLGACELPTPDNYGKKSTMTTNGFINVNVNIYPFSTTGRRFGNGVYIAKIDMVDLPFEGCQLIDGSVNVGHLPFKRIHSEQKFGWMRATSKK